MARRHKNTEEDKIFIRHFPDEIQVMNDVMQEALKEAQDRAKAVQDRIIAEQERTKKKPFWKRTKEENMHAKRIEQANENLSKGGGE